MHPTYSVFLQLQLPNNRLQNLGQDLRRITHEQKISLIQSANRAQLSSIHINQGDLGALGSRARHVSRGRVDSGRRTNDHDEIDRALIDERLNLAQRIRGQFLAEPDDAGPQQARLAGGTVRQVGGRDGGRGRGVQIGGARSDRGLGCGEAVIGGGVDGEDRVERVVVVVLLDVGAVETFDVEEGTVEQFELFAGVVCSLGESCFLGGCY